MTRRILVSLSLCTLMLLAAAAAHADVVGPHRQSRTEVNPFSTDSYSTMTFWAGERAVVAVQGNGGTPLHVRVFDQNGHFITDDVCQQYNCQLAWTPRWTGQFRITIQNLGGVENWYSLWVE